MDTNKPLTFVEAVKAVWATIFSFALLTGVIVGVAAFLESAYNPFASRPARVECHAGGSEIYSGLTEDGVSNGWNSKSLTELTTGENIRIDKSATCVERQITRPEAKRLRAMWGK